MKISIKTNHSRKRLLAAEEVSIHGNLRAHKQKRLCEETQQEHESWSFSKTQESFRALKESSMDSVSLQQKTEEYIIAKIRRFEATILRAEQKKMDCIKWKEKMRYDREKLKKEEDAKEEEEEEEEVSQIESEAAKEEKKDKVLPVYFLVNNKCLL